MKVTWSLRALVQFQKAHAYIAQNNVSAAVAFLDATENLAKLLAVNPSIGLATDESGVIVFPLVRYQYLLFYKITARKEIRIIRLRHTSRKPLR